MLACNATGYSMMDERALFESKMTSADDDDAALLKAIAEGDEPALRLLYDRHKLWLASRLRQRMSVDAVEDVLQETFLAVWKSAARYQSSGDVAAWIWGIARRQAALWFRKHGHERRAAEFLNDMMTSHDDPARSATNRVDIQQAFATLGPSGREMARQALIEDRPIAEIAQSLNIPSGTVKSRIFHLRRKLSATLGKEHAP
jgi:RNA polymerase sigma-70 factor (ECF subfamily)